MAGMAHAVPAISVFILVGVISTSREGPPLLSLIKAGEKLSYRFLKINLVAATRTH
jgi:hypothetical protein